MLEQVVVRSVLCRLSPAPGAPLRERLRELDMPGSVRREVTPGLTTASISNAMVSLLHRYTGRGPTQARTTIDGDMIVCVMRAALTRGERSLVQAGRAEVVLNSRRAFQDTIQREAIALVQKLSGRRVVAFMSTNHVDPDLAVEIFILEAPVAENDEFLSDGGSAGREAPPLDP